MLIATVVETPMLEYEAVAEFGRFLALHERTDAAKHRVHLHLF